MYFVNKIKQNIIKTLNLQYLTLVKKSSYLVNIPRRKPIMKFKKFPQLLALTFVGSMCACNSTLPTRVPHRDVTIYSATIDGVKKDDLVWASSYNEVIKMAKSKPAGAIRNEYLHQAEDILMSTGAVAPIYYAKENCLQSPDMSGFYSTSLGHKFFHQATINGSGEYKVCLGPVVDTLDPAKSATLDGGIIISHAFEGLFRWKKPELGEITDTLELGQAESYEKTSVGTDGHVKYTFKLKENLAYSDGLPLKASNFARAWSRAASGKLDSPYGYLFSSIVGYNETAKDKSAYTPLSGVVANDEEETLEVELISDVPYFLELTTCPAFMPVKMDKVQKRDGSEDNSWWKKVSNYIGNGPLKLSGLECKNNGYVEFEANPNYVDKDDVKVTKLTFVLSDDESYILNKYIDKTLKYITTIKNDQIEALKVNSDFYNQGQVGTYYIVFNVNDRTFNKFLVTEKEYSSLRKALSLLIDRDTICKTIAGAGSEPANTFVSKGIMQMNADGTLVEWTTKSGLNRDGAGYFKIDAESRESNIEEAISAIRTLGFKYDGKKFTNLPAIKVLYQNGSTNQSIMEYIQNEFKQYGIKLQLVGQDRNDIVNNLRNGKYSVSQNAWFANYSDASSFLDKWVSDAGANEAQFGR